MRLMVSNAADPERFRTALLNEGKSMDDFLVLAAKKLIGNDAYDYEPTGKELVYLLTLEMKRAALVDDTTTALRLSHT